jgi:carbonic anhydrase/acetyltransferase-like protein (isoleucine patch superfamily)
VSIVAAGAVVREGDDVPPGSFVAGVPARVVRELSDEACEHISRNADSYIALAEVYRAATGDDRADP